MRFPRQEYWSGLRVAISFSRGSSQSKNWICVFYIGRWILYHRTTWEAHNNDFSSIQSLSRVQLFAIPWITARQASLSITNSQSLLKLMSTESVIPSNHLILYRPLSSCLQSLPELGSFSMSQFFASGGQSIRVSASTSVLPMNIQDWFPSGLVGCPCSPRDSQESSPTPQFKSINSAVLSSLHSLTLTSVHDYWKNHSLD